MSFQPKQLEYICLEDLIPQNHIYREFQSLWDLSVIKPELEKIEQNSDHKGYGIYRRTYAIPRFSGDFIVVQICSRAPTSL